MKLSIRLVLIAFMCTGLSAFGQKIDHWETAVFSNDIWSYFPGTSEPNVNWRSLDFDDSAWLKGKGGVGFGDNDDSTTIIQCTSVYLRISFNVTNSTCIAAALLSMDYDDAFVAYLNDIEIARVGISDTHPAFNSLGNDHEASMYQGKAPETFMINASKLTHCLRLGKNVLAVQVHNSSVTSSDLSSNVFLSFGITNKNTYFRSNPSWFITPLDFTSSNLPIIKISTTNNAVIMDEPKITANMKVFDNRTRNNLTDTTFKYNGPIGIEIRGAYSQTLPQKPYGIETRDEIGENKNVELLGMPKENDWVLLANYNDKTFIRNSLAFEIFRRMGHYAPRLKHCEVVVNDDYQGIFNFGEKIKQDKNRVNIASLKTTDNSGNEITGGYIFKTDYYSTSTSWLSNFSPINRVGAKVYFVYYDPKPDEITVAQKAYLKNYVNALETALYSNNYKNPAIGYRAYLDVSSFIDYFIIGEVSRNVDAYKKSRYFYKDCDSIDRKVYSGPVWDYDWAFKNIKSSCANENNPDGSGWSYRVNDCNCNPIPPSWEVRMLEDDDFANALHTRYVNLRNTILSDSEISLFIDSIANLVDEAQQRHYRKWPIIGINTGAPEVDAQPTTYAGEIQKFKNWLNTRLTWLDANMPGHYIASENLEIHHTVFRIFPNPVMTILYVESDKPILNVMVTKLSGQVCLTRQNINSCSTTIDFSILDRGIYLVTVILTNGETLTERIIRQ